MEVGNEFKVWKVWVWVGIQDRQDAKNVFIMQDSLLAKTNIWILEDGSRKQQTKEGTEWKNWRRKGLKNSLDIAKKQDTSHGM